MQFQYEPHHRTQVPLLRSDEDPIETLEDNQVQLQNLMSSKYIAHFLEEVSLWQRKLSVADGVISIWFEVQRTWTHLESIFIGSEDIRSQLPEVRHTHTHTCTHILTHAQRHTHTHKCTHMLKDTHTQMHTHSHAHMHSHFTSLFFYPT
jgi:hypothetical protein